MTEQSSAQEQEVAMLARKRARDRKAQSAMRDRTKAEINDLRYQLHQTHERMALRQASLSQELACCVDENASMRREIEELRQQFMSSSPHPRFKWYAMDNLCLDASALSAWCSDFGPASQALTTNVPNTQHSSPAPTSQADHLQFPIHSSPACASDKIMLPFIQQMRSWYQQHERTQSMSSSQQASAHSSLATVQSAISKVAVDVLSTYAEIDTLPKKMAALYIIMLVLNVSNTYITLLYRLTFDSGLSWGPEKLSKRCHCGCGLQAANFTFRILPG
jgi:hypothetical protein